MSVSHTTRVFKLEQQLVLSLCENIDSPRALTVALLIRNCEWSQLVSLPIDWRHYDDSSTFMDDYLVTSILSKNPRLPTGVNLREIAIQKFRAAEEVCRQTNLRLSQYQNSGITPDLDVHLAIHHAREFIRGVLGPLTRSDLHFCEGNMGFGPGATTSVSGVVTQGTKYSPRTLDTTPRLVNFGLFGHPPGWPGVKGFRIRNSSKLTTVPKNAKTDRVICIEPDLNIFYQKGVGALIRDKLMRAGLDLSTQSKNQELASKAIPLDLSTVDLSAASDTIARELIWTLLPERWVELLMVSRVDFTCIDGVDTPLEKWSSMGNGYTFELETLIFWAVLHGVQRVTGSTGPIIAYGDDMICPNSDFEVLQRVLTFLGFSTNVDKTFGKGRFHESCGTDWFDGRNVRPLFLKSDHHDFQTVCYIYANGLRRWAHHRNSGVSCDRRVLPAWLRCFTAVEPGDRHWVPEGFGDVGFVENFDKSSTSCKVKGAGDRNRGRVKPVLVAQLDPLTHKYGWGGFRFVYRSIESRKLRISESGCLSAALNGVSAEWSLAIESLRGRFRTATTRRGYTLVWPSLGPWL